MCSLHSDTHPVYSTYIMCSLHSDTHPVYSTYIDTTPQIYVISCSFVEYNVTKPIPGLNRRITKINYTHALGFSLTSINGYCNWSAIIQAMCDA